MLRLWLWVARVSVLVFAANVASTDRHWLPIVSDMALFLSCLEMLPLIDVVTSASSLPVSFSSYNLPIDRL